MNLDLIDTRAGTDSDSRFSTGNTLPLVAVPHGAVGWTPQTFHGRWLFDRRAPKIQGFRATRQPSPWMGDYGDFLILVASGARPPDCFAAAESSYRASECLARPDWFRATLLRHNVIAEVTPTAHGACFRFTFCGRGGAWIAFVPGAGEVVVTDARRGSLGGYSSSNQGGAPVNFRAHYVVRLSAPILGSGAFDSPVDVERTDQALHGRWAKLRRPRDGIVTGRVASSLIGPEQARLNLERELGDRSFEQVQAEAQALWESALQVVELEGATVEQKQTFYRCLHRCRMFPRRIDEIDEHGRRVHYSPFDGRVHAGPLYTDCGFWDGYRVLFPLLTLIAPAVINDMIAGWLNAFKEGGWLPNWASPGYRAGMVGSHGPVVIADAWMKGIRDFDAEVALAAMLRDARESSDSAAWGRCGGEAYAELGYVPADRFEHAVARTLDYAHGDDAIERFARAIGRESETQFMRGRQRNYRHVFDRRTGFFRGRRSDGRWSAPLDPFNWSRDYIEGNAWHYRWSVPHDPVGLIALHGGPGEFARRMDQMLALPTSFSSDFYAGEIHEMTEMAAVPFGQYAHCNEPVHHALYLYTCAGRPDRTQYWVRRVMDELYAPERYPGDEDNGAMSAWYVMSALGIFPLTGGVPAYVLGAPRFPRATILVPGEPGFSITTHDGQAPASFVKSVALNGRRVRETELPHAEIKRGGELIFTSTEIPGEARARGRILRGPDRSR